MNILKNLRIPTLLGLFVLILGTGAGVYLTLEKQNLAIKAAPETNAKNILITNIDDTSASISWQTDIATTGFVTFGTDSPSQTVLDDRDTTSPTPRRNHYVSLHLNPSTTYQFRVHSGKVKSETKKFTSANLADQNGFKPVIGSVIDGNKPLEEGIVYLQMDGAITQSSVIKNLGNFIIPISKIRKADLSPFSPTGVTSKLIVYSEDGRDGSAIITLANSDKPYILKLDQNLDLSQTLGTSKIEGDVNGDGIINSLDLLVKQTKKDK